MVLARGGCCFSRVIKQSANTQGAFFASRISRLGFPLTVQTLCHQRKLLEVTPTQRRSLIFQNGAAAFKNGQVLFDAENFAKHAASVEFV